jgi:pimeloyl-ACP methyl ester carboxylesterase
MGVAAPERRRVPGAAAQPVTTLPMPHVDGVEHRYQQVDGVRLHFAEAGHGDPLVLVHGWPQHWWCWRELIGPLSEHYRVICPDIRGLGWSEAPPSDYSRSRLVADLFGLLDALGIERVRFVGHDWGLAIGYQAALADPDRFERLVPMGGPHPWSPSGGPPRLYLRPWHIYLNPTPIGRFAIRRLGLPELLMRDWRHSGRFTPEEVEIFTSPLRRPESANASMRRYRDLVLRDIPFFVRRHKELRLRVPTLHLNGENDPLTQDVPDSYRGYADDMRLEQVPDCGHFPADERPGWVLDRLLEFLR